METINIEMSFDNKRIKYIDVALYSIMKHTKSNVNIYFITQKVSDQEVKDLIEKLNKKFDNRITMTHIDFDDYLSTTTLETIPFYAEANILPSIVMSRLYLFDILPEVDRIIHLDDDILVRGDLLEYWNFNPDAPLVAHKNNKLSILNNPIYQKYNIKSYFNAGSIILNLKYMREHNVYNSLLTLAKENPEMKIEDEMLLNIYYNDLVADVGDCRYNLINDDCFARATTYPDTFGTEVSGWQLPNSLDDVVLVHFAYQKMISKPWDYEKMCRIIPYITKIKNGFHKEWVAIKNESRGVV